MKKSRVTPCISCFCAPRHSRRVPEAEGGETPIKQLAIVAPCILLTSTTASASRVPGPLEVDTQTKNDDSGLLFFHVSRTASRPLVFYMRPKKHTTLALACKTQSLLLVTRVVQISPLQMGGLPLSYIYIYMWAAPQTEGQC